MLKALLIGNSNGIGLAATRELLKQGWNAVGISRSQSPVKDSLYRHVVAEAQNDDYPEKLKSVLAEEKVVDLCIYCAGIGELLNPTDMKAEVKIFEVNLLGMVRTASLIIPAMVKNGKGHFIGISSMADEMLSPDAPSYHASKAGFSNYLEGLALALKPTGVRVTNLRFGFVNTKMAQGDVKPFMINVERAVRHLLRCIEKKPIRRSAPRIVIPLVKFRKWMMKLSTLLIEKRGEQS